MSAAHAPEALDIGTEADAIEQTITGTSADPLTVQLYDPDCGQATPCGTATFHRPAHETAVTITLRCKPWETECATRALRDKLSNSQRGPSWELYFVGGWKR